MSIAVKICGIQDDAALQAAIEGGARYVGFVFEKSSRRYIATESAANLAKNIPSGTKAVGLFVNPSSEELEEVTNRVRLDMIQLHGHETPKHVVEIRTLTSLPVIKAIHIATENDFAIVSDYEKVADMLLFDTKLGPEPTGGTGIAFNWNLLKGKIFTKPWMLAGGLNIGNISEAVAITGARIIDISSGVENADGNKDPAKINSLLKLAEKL